MLPIMQQEVDWILKALARDPSKTRAGLARALNIDKSGVSRMLKGARRLKYEEAQKAAAYLGVAPGGPMAGLIGGGLAEDGAPYAAEQGRDERLPSVALIDASSGGDGFWLLDQRNTIERRPRAPQFADAKDIFGFYAPDNAMAPRFHAGEVIWVNPARPAGPGKDGLVIGVKENNFEMSVFLGVVSHDDAGRLHVTQYGSGVTKTFPANEWRAVHVYGRD